MREITIEANLKLLSLNKAFVSLKNGRRIRSKEYVKFANEVKVVMAKYRYIFKLFNDTFDPKLHELHGFLTYSTPELYTKTGTISKNSGDLANMEKCLVDNVLTGSVDDSAIVSWEFRKIYSEAYSFSLTFKIIER